MPLGACAEWVRDAGSDPAVLVRGVIDSLTASEHGHPVIVGVDDAHLLDDLSAFVVHQLVHRRIAKVIVIVRNRETLPEAIAALYQDAHVQPLELAALTRDDVGRLLAASFDGPVNPIAVQRLWSLTRGNVLFLRHLAEQELADGRLRKERGIWAWHDETLAFTTLGELIDAEMGALSESVSEVVDLLAVGEPVDVDVLATMVSSQAVEEARTKGLVALGHERKRSSARLAHPLYGEVRRARAGELRLRRLRGRLVRALAAVAAARGSLTSAPSGTAVASMPSTPELSSQLVSSQSVPVSVAGSNQASRSNASTNASVAPPSGSIPSSGSIRSKIQSSSSACAGGAVANGVTPNAKNAPTVVVAPTTRRRVLALRDR